MPVPFDPRQIRSYVIRAGRMTPGQSNALETQWQHYGLEPGSLPITPQSLFSTEAPLVLEIGFGMGDSLFEMLQQQPDRNFIGVEVHKPGWVICCIWQRRLRSRISGYIVPILLRCCATACRTLRSTSYRSSFQIPGTKSVIINVALLMRTLSRWS